MTVMKFGGTSLGNGERILRAAKLVADERARQPVVVVSAMSQVTNTLVDLSADVSGGRPVSKLAADIERLRGQHHQAAKDLGLDAAAEKNLLANLDGLIAKLQDILNDIATQGELTPRAHDLIICFGERLAIHLVAAALQKNGLDATAMEASELLITDDSFGNAVPLLPATRKHIESRLKLLLAKGINPVITGFMGATAEGVVTTLGRGGSDYSATIFGYCLDADEVWIWTDVDGVMTADPRAVKGAHTIDELSYDEAAELSYFGAKVLHPRTMLPAAMSDIPIQIKNTLRPEGRSTKITGTARQHPDGAKAMSMLNGLSLITIQGKGMQGIYGLAARVFSALAEQQINVLFISQASSENNISLAVNGRDGSKAVTALTDTFQAELKAKNVETVQAEPDTAMIAVVGEGMRSHRGIAGRIFSTLGQADINVIAIAQGSSERNITFIVKETDAVAALQSIHDELHLENGKVKGQPDEPA